MATHDRSGVTTVAECGTAQYQEGRHRSRLTAKPHVELVCHFQYYLSIRYSFLQNLLIYFHYHLQQQSAFPSQKTMVHASERFTSPSPRDDIDWMGVITLYAPMLRMLAEKAAKLLPAGPWQDIFLWPSLLRFYILMR